MQEGGLHPQMSGDGGEAVSSRGGVGRGSTCDLDDVLMLDCGCFESEGGIESPLMEMEGERRGRWQAEVSGEDGR